MGSERRVRRNAGKGPFILKVDGRNGDSPDLVMGYEELVFSRPGFEELMRDNSVPEGQAATPLSAEERERIRERHRWHTVTPHE